MSPVYRRLEHGYIRLLTLLPGDAFDPLSCSLQEVSLESSPYFETISCAREAFDVSENLTIQACESNESPKFIPISSQILSLLLSLRSPVDARTLWIYEICVEHADSSEKSTQMKLLRQIFESAVRVILGEYLGGRRVGSDTSSECGVGRRAGISDEEADDDDDEEGDEGYESGPLSDNDPNIVDDRTSSTVSSDTRAYLERVNAPEPPMSPSELLRTETHQFFSGIGWFLRSKYRHYFVYGYWNPYRAWRSSRAWERAVLAWELNQSRVGHIAFGRPVLYENHMDYFFQERYRADWEAVDRLLEHPWWSQTWTVLEVGCAKDRAALPFAEAWNDMGKTMIETEDVRMGEWPQLKERYGRAFHLLKKRLMDGKLSDLLWNTWDRDVADPRDKVFAMLSLAGSFHCWSQPDYNRSVKQVFCAAARDIIRGEDSLDILLAGGRMKREDEAISLPSWVPDWRREYSPLQGRPMPLVDRSRIPSLFVTGSIESLVVNGHGFTASAGAKPLAWFSHDLDRLHVRAVFVDEVESTAPPHGPRSEIGVKNTVNDACLVARAAFFDGKPHWWNKDEKDGLPGLVKRVLMAGSRGMMDEEEVIGEIMIFRRFFVSKDEREHKQATKNGTTLYELVGEAYVHGIMKGEVMAGKKPKVGWEKFAWWRSPRKSEASWEELVNATTPHI
ncbi:heterokaryon incompatibility protein [Colletotrichum salicis]|uniref:Heterokaryon incompatibility protein n=1 Tax=Colletotrichum salicis TaxID=1209931 RepID=A0A135U0Y9_9PEZI|nr:heterokaryon incompatibility protein [Colletotrichum salicis]